MLDRARIQSCLNMHGWITRFVISDPVKNDFLNGFVDENNKIWFSAYDAFTYSQTHEPNDPIKKRSKNAANLFLETKRGKKKNSAGPVGMRKKAPR